MTIDLQQLFSLLAVIVLGAAIGFERECSRKAAGLRMSTLICLGTCVFTIISKQMGVLYTGSSTRIAAHIVIGVGFLGVSAIIQDRSGVQGIITAAIICLATGLGISCVTGFYSVDTHGHSSSN